MSLVTVQSPLGPIRLSGCVLGLHEIKLPGRRPPESGPMMPAGPLPEDTPESLAQCVAWLQTYFHEPQTVDSLPWPALHHPVFQQDSFTRQVLQRLQAAVGPGEVVSYQKLAALAGNPQAARAVGRAMKYNPVPILIPCHRVIHSNGNVGPYSGGPGVKEWLLDHEGVLALPVPGNTGLSQPGGRCASEQKE